MQRLIIKLINTMDSVDWLLFLFMGAFCLGFVLEQIAGSVKSEKTAQIIGYIGYIIIILSVVVPTIGSLVYGIITGDVAFILGAVVFIIFLTIVYFSKGSGCDSSNMDGPCGMD